VQTSFSDETKTGLLVLVLMACDVACSATPWFAEIRGYALWKAARHVQLLYDEQWRDAMLALALVILSMVSLHLCRCRRHLTTAEQSISELTVLVCVNVFVNALTPNVSTEGTGRGLLLLLLYLIAGDVLTGTVV